MRLVERDEKKLVGIILVTKLILLASVYLIFQLGLFCDGCYRQNRIYPAGDDVSWVSSYKTWDANHILYLADHGYAKSEENNQATSFSSHVILPLYPWLIRAFRPFAFNNSMATGILLSNIFSLLAMLYFFRLVRTTHGERIAFESTLYALAFPTSFFFTRVYTESLFFLLAILFFYHLYKHHVKRAAFFSFWLPMTRLVGLLCVVSFIIHVLNRRKNEAGPGGSIYPDVIWAFAPLLGLAVELVLMGTLTGNGFESFMVQGSRYSISGMLNVPRWFLENFVYVSWAWHGFANSAAERAFFVFYLIVLLWIYRNQDKTMFSYAFLLGLVPALSDHLMSFSRMLIVVFPIYIALAQSTFNHRRMQFLMFATQLVLLGLHAMAYWVA